MDHNIYNPHNEAQSLRQGDLSPTIFAQQLCYKMQTCRCFYHEKAPRVMLVESTRPSIRKMLRNRWAEHQDALPEDLTRKAEFLFDLQGH